MLVRKFHIEAFTLFIDLEGVKLEFHKEVYHPRSKVETFFSVIKRKYGNHILSRTFESQKKEVIFRLLAYNIDRKLILSFLKIMVSPGPQSEIFIYLQCIIYSRW